MRRPLKFAGLSGIIILVLACISWIVSLIIGENPNLAYFIFSLILSLVMLTFMGFWYFGFIVLGGKFKEGKLLKVISWIFFVLLITSFVLILIMVVYSIATGSVYLSPEVINLTSSNYQNQDMSGALGVLLAIILAAFVLVILIVVVFMVLRILFGVGLLKLGDKVPMAKVAGILEIIGTLTLIIFVGIFVLFAAMIVEIIMFFKASKKFE
jgi:hypothetical protein